MKRCAAAVGILLGTILANPNAEAAGPYGSINVGNWKGGAYTNDQGDFSHCAAGASYLSGIYFVVAIDSKSGWSLRFAHEKWNLAAGRAFPIELTFEVSRPSTSMAFRSTTRWSWFPCRSTRRSSPNSEKRKP